MPLWSADLFAAIILALRFVQAVRIVSLPLFCPRLLCSTFFFPGCFGLAASAVCGCMNGHEIGSV